MTLTAVDDTVPDAGETVILAFGALPAPYLAGATTSVTVTLGQPANAVATGPVAIDGEPVRGETLTANVSAVMDANGFTAAAIAYRWLRTAAGETEEAGTGPSYGLDMEEVGATMTLEASFTDHDGYAETLLSDPTVSVTTAARPGSADARVTAAEGVDYAFGAPDFPFTASSGGAALASLKIATLPAAGTGALALDGTAIAAGDLPKTVTAAQLGEGKLTFSPVAGQFGHGYASFTFRVDDGVVDSEPANTMAVDIAADPAYRVLVRNQRVDRTLDLTGATSKALTQGFAVPRGRCRLRAARRGHPDSRGIPARRRWRWRSTTRTPTARRRTWCKP